MLDDNTRQILGVIASNPEYMDALEALVLQIKQDRLEQIKLPMTLDEYGAMFGSTQVLEFFIDEIKYNQDLEEADSPM